MPATPARRRHPEGGAQSTAPPVRSRRPPPPAPWLRADGPRWAPHRTRPQRARGGFCRRTSAAGAATPWPAASHTCEQEPVETVRAQGEQVGQLADPRKRIVAEALHGNRALVLAQIQLHVLAEARQVVDYEDALALVFPDVREHLLVARLEEADAAARQRRVALSDRDKTLHPVEQRGRHP